MRKLIVFFVGLLFISIFFSDCKKYLDDGSSHFLTARERLSHKQWTTYEIFNRNTQHTMPLNATCANCDIINFSFAGEFDGSQSVLFGFKGKWKFTNHKNDLLIYDDNHSLTFIIDALDFKVFELEKDSLIYSFEQN